MAKERELQKVHVKKEDIELIVSLHQAVLLQKLIFPISASITDQRNGNQSIEGGRDAASAQRGRRGRAGSTH